MNVVLAEEDRQFTVGKDGVITIPAASCVSPLKDTSKILFMKSRLGGHQLHYKGKGPQENMVYEIEVPEAGDYELSAKVVTIGRDQSLDLQVNESEAMVKLPLPFDLGNWAKSEPILVKLKKGKNTLSFTRVQPEKYGGRVWSQSGPEFGGVSIRVYSLKKK